MCSIGEDDFGDDGGIHSMVKEICLEEKPNELCNKCNKHKSVVKLGSKEAKCKTCFSEHVRHKFRAVLGSTKILPKDAKVLIIFDGRAESVVLLDILHHAITQNTFKRLHCHPLVLYIDQGCLTNSGHEELSFVKRVLSSYNLRAFYLSIAAAQNPQPLDSMDNAESYKEQQNFIKGVGSIKTLTSQKDFLVKVRYKKIKSAAEHLDCNYVFLPDTSTALATNLLHDIILGRGASTALDVSLLDDRVPNLKIIRPIKDLSMHELEKYIELNNLENLPDCLQQQTEDSSLQNLTKLFVSDLQTNFPSTVSTIFRTGDKLASSEPKVISDTSAKLLDNSQKCRFCFANLDYLDAQTLFATEFSRLVSQNASNDLNDLENLELMATLRLQAINSPILMKLCHGCRNIYHDYPDYFLNYT